MKRKKKNNTYVKGSEEMKRRKIVFMQSQWGNEKVRVEKV